MTGNDVNKDVNNYNGKFADQRWLVAHNAWNTGSVPNQGKDIAELLDYGVRGLALDILGDSEISLHLQHGGDLLTVNKWKTIRDELDIWLKKNPDQIVTLFFESYLTGPDPTPMVWTALQGLDNSLKQIECYRAGMIPHQSGEYSQIRAITDLTLNDLVANNHRLFAFIEQQPDEGRQDVFPTMRSFFAENVYGDASLKRASRVNLREGSAYKHLLTFMNHFGNAPTQSEWNRNRKGKLIEHAEAFTFRYGGRYPNFISLDYINWTEHRRGPIEALEELKLRKDFKGATPFHMEGKNDFDNVVIDVDDVQKIVDLHVKPDEDKGIMKIRAVRGDEKPVVGITLLNSPGKGIIDLRYKKEGEGFGDWLVNYQAGHQVGVELIEINFDGALYGICSRTQDDYGVTDLAAVYR